MHYYFDIFRERYVKFLPSHQQFALIIQIIGAAWVHQLISYIIDGYRRRLSIIRLSEWRYCAVSLLFFTNFCDIINWGIRFTVKCLKRWSHKSNLLWRRRLLVITDMPLISGQKYHRQYLPSKTIKFHDILPVNAFSDNHRSLIYLLC